MEPDFHLNSGQLPVDWQAQVGDRGYAIIEAEDGTAQLLTTLPLPAPAAVQPLTIDEATSALLDMLTNGATLGGPWQQFDSEDADIATDGILAFELGEPEADPAADPLEDEPSDGEDVAATLATVQASQVYATEMRRCQGLQEIRREKERRFWGYPVPMQLISELTQDAILTGQEPHDFAVRLDAELANQGFVCHGV